MSLISGHRVTCHKWKELPIAEAFIAAVENLAVEEGQPRVKNNGLLFTWEPHNPKEDSEENPQDNTASYHKEI